MRLTINGDIISLDNIITVSDLIKQLGLHDKIAIEINREIVPRSQFDIHPLRQGDTIEIVRAIGGG
ncbi:MAG: sulfur carrier protein ThiS [Gammaproteobacteria bacterium]|nr:sulfur carrier protein ThiS [Gammaproteobacteria bacterium]